jgi:protocatechuate 3,4-dioxygenase beta subunit
MNATNGDESTASGEGASTEPPITSGLVLPSYPRVTGVHPPLDSPDYVSTRLRHPSQPLALLPQRLTEITGPLLGEGRVGPLDNDLTRQHPGEPLGQRIIVHGQVVDADGRPIPSTLIEIWQTNAGGRYRHARDNWPAPLDPNFTGVGRTVTDTEGRYRFTTIKPGAYPWTNGYNAWRPAHIHFSLFGRAFAQRLITQMYFPGDPLFSRDPVFLSIPDEAARQRLIARYDHATTKPQWALGFEFNVVLRGSGRTPFEEEHDDE